MINLKEKICVVCGKWYTPINNRQKYCKECKEIVKKRNKKTWNKIHKEKIKEYYKERHKNNYKNHVQPRICKECGKEYIPNSSRQKYCKECGIIIKKTRVKEYNKIYWQNNNKELKIYMKNYRQENKEEILEYKKEYRQTHKEEINQHQRNRRKNDINYKIKYLCRNQVYRCVKSKKDKCTFDILGYTLQEFKQRLEFQFKNGMTWDNYGVYWQIHHKKELSRFNFVLPNDTIDYHQIMLANSLANLQPITIEEHKKLTAEFMKNK